MYGGFASGLSPRRVPGPEVKRNELHWNSDLGMIALEGMKEIIRRISGGYSDAAGLMRLSSCSGPAAVNGVNGA